MAVDLDKVQTGQPISFTIPGRPGFVEGYTGVLQEILPGERYAQVKGFNFGVRFGNPEVRENLAFVPTGRLCTDRCFCNLHGLELQETNSQEYGGKKFYKCPSQSCSVGHWGFRPGSSPADTETREARRRLYTALREEHASPAAQTMAGLIVATHGLGLGWLNINEARRLLAQLQQFKTDRRAMSAADEHLRRLLEGVAQTEVMRELSEFQIIQAGDLVLIDSEPPRPVSRALVGMTVRAYRQACYAESRFYRPEDTPEARQAMQESQRVQQALGRVRREQQEARQQAEESQPFTLAGPSLTGGGRRYPLSDMRLQTSLQEQRIHSQAPSPAPPRRAQPSQPSQAELEFRRAEALRIKQQKLQEAEEKRRKLQAELDAMNKQSHAAPAEGVSRVIELDE